VGHSLPQVLQRRGQETRPLGIICQRWVVGRCFDILASVDCGSSQPLPQPTVASWCNWLTRRPLKAESSGSIPDDATKQISQARRRWRAPLGATAGGTAGSGWLSAVFCFRSTRIRPELVHHVAMCVFAHSPKSQKSLLGREFIANAPSSGRSGPSAGLCHSNNWSLPSRR
jgi:hypothetical protein